ncbi:MAG: hypothetical protein WCR72_14975 [Bacteroidota bacterium]
MINPVYWTRDESVATTVQGLGSFKPDTAGVFSSGPQYADAKLVFAKGVVTCSAVSENLIATLASMTGWPWGV